MNYNISIHQTTCKNKAKPFKYISDQKVKLTLENIFKVKY